MTATVGLGRPITEPYWADVPINGKQVTVLAQLFERRALTYKAMGWRLAEKVNDSKLLAGDRLDIAFTLDHNEHPEFGGIELSLRDFKAAAYSPSALAAEQS